MVAAKKQATARNNLYNRLFNFKFEQAVQYLAIAAVSPSNEKLVEWLADRFGNLGLTEGDIAVPIYAALLSIDGYREYIEYEDHTQHLVTIVFGTRGALYGTIANGEFRTALNYMQGADLAEDHCKLIEWLAARFGDDGDFSSDISVLIDAALKSLPGFEG